MSHTKLNAKLLRMVLEGLDAGCDGLADTERAHLTVFAGLSPRNQEIILLRRDLKSIEEIAAIVGATPKAVKCVLYRFRKAFRAELHRQREDDRCECCGGSNRRSARAPPARR